MATFDGGFSVRPHLLRLTVNQGTQNIVGNYTDVNWNLRIYRAASWKPWGSDGSWSVNIHGNAYSGSFSYNFNNYTELLLASGTTRIYHNADGTATISVSASAYIGSAGGSASCGGSMGLTTIPRASTPSFSASPANAGTTVTINTNRASTSFTHDITYSVGSLVDQPLATGVGASVNWPIPLSILNQITNATQAPVAIKVVTKSGSTVIGTTTTNLQVAVPTSVVPDFTTITHDEATTVPDVEAIVGSYVQGVSKLALAITGAVGIYGSTITSYKIEVAGQTINAASGTTPTPLATAGTYNIVGTVTDSRGRTRQKVVSITVLPYAPPVLNEITVERAAADGTPDPDEGTYIRVNIDAAVQSLIVGTQKNTLTYNIYSRLHDGVGWTLKKSVTPAGISFDGYDLISTYLTSQSYDVRVEIVDKFATSTIQFTVSVAQIFMHLDGAVGVGILKYREGDATLDVGGLIRQRFGKKVLDEDNFATNAETQAGTATDKAVTPASLASRTATESRTGLAEIASSSEADAGSDNTRIMTPARVKSVLDKRLPARGKVTGIGSVSNGSGVTVGVTFPASRFSDDGIVVIATPLNAARLQAAVIESSLTSGGVNIRLDNFSGATASGGGVAWIAMED